jgi:hypothetical protein
MIDGWGEKQIVDDLEAERPCYELLYPRGRKLKRQFGG